MPKTVLSIVSTLGRCGPVIGMMNVARYLDPLRYRAVIGTLSPEPADSLIDEFRSLGVPIRQLGLSRLESLFSGVRTLRSLVSEVRPDLVHSHGLRADILVAKARPNCPIVATVHSDLLADYRFAYGRPVGTVAAMREYAALRRFDGVNAVSDPLAEDLLRSGIQARGIMNGVELGEFHPAPDARAIQEIRTQLGWSLDAVVVLHTGVLRNLKSPLQVVEGFRASALSGHGFLVFAGDGPLRSECEKAADGASNIMFLGKRRDVSNLLRAADVLISASSSEGLGTALLEGCASGVRVLATDIPAHKYIESIFPGQVQIFGQSTAASVAKALDSISNQDAQQKFTPSPSALERMSNRGMSSQYQEFYSAILQSTPGAIPEIETAAVRP